MSELIITEKSNIVAIADAVRAATGITSGMTLGEIATNITAAGGGTASMETGTLTCSCEEEAPGTYVVTCNLSGISDIANKKMITLCSTNYESLDSTYSCVAVLFRLNTSENFTAYLGSFVTHGMSITADNNILTIYEASVRDVDEISNLTYYAI